MVLDLSLLGINVAINLILTGLVLYISTKRLIIPVMEAVLEEKLQDTRNMMKAAASALGNKSVEAREIKKMEKAMVGDIMEQYPELEIALEYFSPETAEMIKRHPQRALTLLTRYKPLVDQILGREGDGKLPFQY